MDPQGWYQDPFGVHRFRFFRDGKPTGLVMDDGVETYDEPPEQGAAAPIQSEGVSAGEVATSSTSPAGWYDDPLGEGLRYWDGTTWSDVAVQPHTELEALSQLSRLVNDGGEALHEEPPQPETRLPEVAPPPSPPPSGWWHASDDKWYPPEQHSSYVASQGAGTRAPATASSSGPPSESLSDARTAEQAPSEEWRSHAGPVSPPWPDRPFYNDPWFWIAVAAVIVCPMRRRWRAEAGSRDGSRRANRRGPDE